MERMHTFNQMYSKDQEELIQSEFKRLKDQHYLDHTGGTLYSERQIQDITNELKENLYGNPHAKSMSSHLTDDGIDQIRYEILKFFNTTAEEYSVIFSSSATSALKIVGESFDYKNGQFSYIEDNHTSVLGMREYAQHILPLSIKQTREIFLVNKPPQPNEASNSLFVFPAQSNFSGYKYPLNWIEKTHKNILNSITDMKSQNWFCVLDAASYVSNSFLDLTLHKPDFVPISFYKIFGFPTGIGALLVKNSSSHVLTKKYFGGGTVFLALSSENVVIRRNVLHEKFEDGSLPYLSILSLKHCFNTFKRLELTMNLISQHTFSLAQYFYENLLSLHHSNDRPIAIIYSDTKYKDINSQGGIVNFNLVRANGEYIGYAEVLNFANLNQIHLRTGCFCNPGACKYYLGLSSNDIKHQFEQGHVCGDNNDLINGCPTGSIRVSFGYMTTKCNVDALLDLIEKCFVAKPAIKKKRKVDNQLYAQKPCPTTNESITDLNKNTNRISGVLEHIFIYPVKSCAPYQIIDSWEISATGLKYDRQWMIVNSMGICLTQKRNPYMCLIKPTINLEKRTLTLHFDGLNSIDIPLDLEETDTKSIEICQSKVCGDKIQAFDCGIDVGQWLSKALNTPGLRLLKQIDDTQNGRITKKGEVLNLSLSNQAQYLLLNLATVKWLQNAIPQEERIEDLTGLLYRFRPNFVIDFKSAFVEKNITQISINNLVFDNAGECTRCQMICIDQFTGEKTIEPLKTLSEKTGGKVSFGTYLSCKEVKCKKYIHLKCNVVGCNI